MPLKKTFQFDPRVIQIIAGMEWQNDGRLGVLRQQLDRGTYSDVNKALEALGGRWNKKAKGHIFDFDPRPQFAGLFGSGQLTVEKDGFFRTPEAVVREMLKLMPIGDPEAVRILEPSAGDGAIVDVLLHSGVKPDQVYCIEKNARRCEVLRAKVKHVGCGDFLKYRHSTGLQFPRVFMNPPFEAGQDIAHVMKAFEVLAPGGKMAAVMSEGPFFREDRKATAFRAWLDEVGGESRPLPAKSFHESGTDVNTRLVVIRKG